MDQSDAAWYLTPDEVKVLGAANELVWRAARLISLSCEGLPLAGGTLDPEKKTRWQREMSLRAELASNLGPWGGVFTYIPQPGQSWWTRVGYPAVTETLAPLTVEVAGSTLAARTIVRNMVAQLRAVTPEGSWQEVEEGDRSHAVVRATRDDRAVSLEDAGAWIRERLDELTKVELSPHRRAPAPISPDLGPAERAPLGGSVFSRMRGPKRNLAEHVRLMASLAVDSTPEPLLRDPLPPAELGGYPTLGYFDTSIGALGHLPRVEIAVPGRRPVVCVEGKPGPGERSWTQLHDAITRADGAIWADLRLFLAQSGLALPPVANRIGRDGFALAQECLTRIVATLASVVEDAESKSKHWTLSGSSDKRKALLGPLLREWARTGRLLAWGTSGRDVYIEIGWVPCDGGLALQAAVSADPQRRGLREAILDRVGSSDLERRGWQRSDRGWTAVWILTDGGQPEPATWLVDRVRELGAAGLLARFNRWGAVPISWWPARERTSRSGRQHQHRESVAKSTLAPPSPGADHAIDSGPST